MSEMRIGYLTGEYPRASDTFISREADALRAHGASVEMFSVRRPGGAPHSEREVRERDRTTYLLPASLVGLVAAHAGLVVRSPVRWLRALGLALSVRSPGLRSFVWHLGYLAEAGVLARHARERGLSHLHNHFGDSSCTVAMLAAELGGLTFSFTIHGPAELFEPSRWRFDVKARRAAFVSCISHFCRSQMMIWTPPETWRKLQIVHCGIRPADYPLRSHEERGRTLLFIGRLAPVKGLFVLLEALATVREAHPDVLLRVVGDGPDRAALEMRARELGLDENVDFLGFLDPSEVRRLLGDSDAFVLPSFAEGVPVVLMEALGSGVPAVATWINGVCELVEDGVNGLTVAPGDPVALAAAIGELLDSAELRSRLGVAGRRKVEEAFDIDGEAEWMCRLMQAAVAGDALPDCEDPARQGIG